MVGWGPPGAAGRRSNRATADLFNETFRQGMTPISQATVSRIHRKFQQHGTVRDLPRSGRPPTACNEEKQLDVVLGFIEDPHLSIRRSALQNDIDGKSVHKIMRKILKYRPYKIHDVQEFQGDDPNRRLLFCETIMQRIDANVNYLYEIAFTDEATFTLHGKVNHQNYRCWADQNPHEIRETHSQSPQKLNVWAGVVYNQLIGPFFIQGNLNAATYAAMLTEQIIPALEEIRGEQFDTLKFQQDGAPPHWGINVRNILDEVFPQRWIGRGGPTEWPPRSPDLTPLDFFLWGYLKTKVYRTPVQNLQELQTRIEQECALIEDEMIQNAVENVYYRLAYCQEVNGLQFEHLL